MGNPHSDEMSIQELRDILFNDLKTVEDLIQKAEHRMAGIQKSLDRLKEKDESQRKTK